MSTNPALNSFDSSMIYGRLLENPKTKGLREFFLPENDFETCYTVKVAWKSMEDMKLRLEFFFTCPSTYKLNVI